MTLLLGRNRKQALCHVFRLAGPGGYAGSGGVLRKRLDAMLTRYYRKPAPR